MNKKFSVPRGTADILPEEISSWRFIESTAKEILTAYGYKEIRTPAFEDTELFARSMGQTSDVVQKQMLNLADQERNPLVTGMPDNAFIPAEVKNFSLRPEGTAAVVRSYIENSFDKKESLSKLFYLGPMFRGERPQKGRLRQFHQIGAEAIGPQSASPYLDAELIALSVHLLRAFGLQDGQFKVKINTLGSPEDKENFSKFLRTKLTSAKSHLCEDCQNRFERNVFRILDCKNKDCQAVVAKLKLEHSYLSNESRRYFQNVREALDSLGIAYEQSLTLVRGLDYYTHTVFEITGSSLGSQDALGAGGRYNNLVSQLGGAEVDAIGFALGIERILLALPVEQKPQPDSLAAFFVALDEPALKNAFALLNVLRMERISCDMGFRISSMKSQMRLADKSGARHVIILGEDEVKKGYVTVKDMKSSQQKQITVDRGDYGPLLDLLKGKVS